MDVGPSKLTVDPPVLPFAVAVRVDVFDTLIVSAPPNRETVESVEPDLACTARVSFGPAAETSEVEPAELTAPTCATGSPGAGNPAIEVRTSALAALTEEVLSGTPLARQVPAAADRACALPLTALTLSSGESGMLTGPKVAGVALSGGAVWLALTMGMFPEPSSAAVARSADAEDVCPCALTGLLAFAVIGPIPALTTGRIPSAFALRFSRLVPATP